MASSLDALDQQVTSKEGRNEALADMSGASTADEFKKLEEQQAVDAFLAGLSNPSAEAPPADQGVEMNIAK